MDVLRVWVRVCVGRAALLCCQLRRTHFALAAAPVRPTVLVSVLYTRLSKQ